MSHIYPTIKYIKLMNQNETVTEIDLNINSLIPFFHITNNSNCYSRHKGLLYLHYRNQSID